MLATFATAGQRSATSLAIGPLKIVPFGFPFSSFNTTAALSSNLILVPSARRYSLRCLTITASTTVFLISNFPFLTDAITKSPTPADAILALTVFDPTTEKIFNNFAPELSQVETRASTGSPLVTLLLRAFILLHTNLQ